MGRHAARPVGEGPLGTEEGLDVSLQVALGSKLSTTPG